MTTIRTRSRSEAVAPLDRPDPVAAVLQAHRHGVPLVLGTSGSTGAPREVRRSTGSWFDSFPVVAALTDLDPAARVWVPGPLAGTMNLFAAVLTSWVGATRVERLEDATHVHLTPTLLRRLGGSLSGRHVTVAGDRLDATTYDAAVASGARVAHYYGAAELSFVGWGSHEADLRVFPGVEVSVRDGVLWARSPYLADVATVDGFATVGDRGELHGDRLQVRGRGDAAVLTGAVTVLVEDVEAELRSVAGGEVVVLGVPHPELGQVVAAVVTDPADVAACRSLGLTPSHRPRLWYAVDPLPRTSAGKVDRAALAARVRDGALTRVVP